MTKTSSPPGGGGGAAKPAVAADAKPKEVAMAFANALISGDAATARSVTTGTEEQMKMVDGLVALATSSKKMQDALKEKFGADALKAPDGGPAAPDPEDLKKELESAEEKIEGDTATLTPKEGTPTTLKKVDGRWKVDLASADMPPVEDANKMFAAMTKASDETTAEIKAGKYKTVQEANMAMMTKMMANAPAGEGPVPTLPKPE